MKALKKISITLGVFILLIGALMLVGKIYSEHHPNDPTVRDLNKYNFMIPKEDYFVKTDKLVKKEKFGTDFYNYTYKTVGYDKKGDGKKITYTATKKLKTNHYLKLTTKQDQVLSYSEVKKREIPEDANKNLN